MITQENIPYTADEIKAMVKTCEKYNKALERAQKMQENSNGMILKKWLWGVFPELKESDDERMLREIKRYIQEQGDKPTGLPNGTVPVSDMITWLEKQGKQQGISALEAWKDMRLEVYQQASGNRHEPNYSDDSTKMFSLNDIDEIIEKISEQKSDDKVEPKFKVGDWILNDVCFPVQIASIKDSMYVFTKGDAISVSFVDENYHLWTIQDAMDGDVLVHNECPFIFMGIKDGIVQALEKNLLEGTNPVNFGKPKIDNDYQPATKEQRDLLFRQMKEEGYEWDSEKKELKKVEQGNHPRIVMADFTGGEGFYKLNLNNLNKEQVTAIEIMINNPKPGKRIDADKVIEWLEDNTSDIEYYVNLFKEDFGL